MERRSEVREPIRLRVSFKTVWALISEYTTSISRAGCSIRSAQTVEPGQVFLLELSLEGRARNAITVEGRVVHCTARKDGGFDVGIQYVSASTPRRVATSRFLDEVFAEHLANRKHARVPVNLIAEDADDGTKYLVRDLSRGGLGLRLPMERSLPRERALDQRVELVVLHDGDLPFILPAKIVRLDAGEAPKRQPGIGLRFEALGEANARLVDALLYLHRPRRIVVRFLERRL